MIIFNRHMNLNIIWHGARAGGVGAVDRVGGEGRGSALSSGAAHARGSRGRLRTAVASPAAAALVLAFK